MNGKASEGHGDLRLKYETMIDGYHRITDFRHKLLAFLPLGSAAAIGFLVTVASDTPRDEDVGELISSHLWTIGLFGFVVTLGLYFFEWRQVVRCLAYIDRGKKLEDSLGFSGGFFTDRGDPPLKFVGAESAGVLVYGASAAAWSTVAVFGDNEVVGYALLGLTAAGMVVRLIQTAKRYNTE